MSKVQQKNGDAVQSSAETANSAAQDSLGDHQLSDPLTDPLAGPTQFLGGGPAVSAGGAPPPGSPSQGRSSAVMFKSGGGMSAGQVHQTAAEGISGGGGSLPFQGAIQQSFGGHDVSGVKAFTGGAASRANESMGSAAYTKGSSVAFKGAPNLHTTAHEAAHVVQQRAGVNVPGGVGQRGDSYERHADAVADTVVQGKSAAPMLDQFVGGAKAASVQHSMADGGDVQFLGFFESIGRGIGKGLRAVGNWVTGKPPGQAAFEEAEIFVDHGKYGPEEYTCSDTNMGGFEVTYWPFGGDGWEKIIMRAAIEYISPVTFDGAKAVPYRASDDAATDIADTINTNNATPAARQTAVAGYTWTDTSGYTDKIHDQVFHAWSFEHSFTIPKVGWKWVGAEPSVDVQVHEGAKAANDHIDIKLFKIPAGGWMGSSAEGGGDNRTMRLDTEDFNEDPEARTRSFDFAEGSDSLAGQPTTRLDDFNRRYMGTDTNASSARQPVAITIGDSASGSASLGQKRAKAVQDYMTAAGWAADRITVTVKGTADDGPPAPADPAANRNVSLTLTNTGQTTLLHEFGHAFGLDDEYASRDAKGNEMSGGTGGTVGQTVDHDQLAKNAGGDGAICENSDNMMSIGNEVRPQHYATFHEALCQVTGYNEWKLGTAISKAAARAEAIPADTSLDGQQGDFNVPDGDTRMA